MGLFDAVKGMFGSKGSTQVAAPSLAQGEEFALVLANLLFKIDGRDAKEEIEELARLGRHASADLNQRIEDIVHSPEKFLALEQWCRSLSLDNRQVSRLADELNKHAAIDKERTPEEDAFLIQVAQILDQNEKVPLFITTSAAPKALVTHDFFEYLGEDEFRRRFPASQCEFYPSRIYTRHPYLNDSLMPFSVDEFNCAQNEIYDGIIDVLRDLGAKRLVISRSQEECQKELYSGKGGVSIKGKADVSLAANYSTEEYLRSKETIKARFDGTSRPLLTRLFPGRWRRGLINKYKNNPHYATIIQNRFGHNKLKHLEYQFNSKQARKVAAGMAAALKMKVPLVSGNASFNIASNKVEAVEKYFFVEFH